MSWSDNAAPPPARRALHARPPGRRLQRGAVPQRHRASSRRHERRAGPAMAGQGAGAQPRTASRPATRSSRAAGSSRWSAPPGVGKTTTTAKLAARCAVRYGASKLALITTDSFRIGAQDQLRIYAKILGVVVHTVSDRHDLRQALDAVRGRHLVLIDTVGMSQRDARVARAGDAAGAARDPPHPAAQRGRAGRNARRGRRRRTAGCRTRSTRRRERGSPAASSPSRTRRAQHGAGARRRDPPQARRCTTSPPASACPRTCSSRPPSLIGRALAAQRHEALRVLAGRRRAVARDRRIARGSPMRDDQARACAACSPGATLRLLGVGGVGRHARRRAIWRARWPTSDRAC